ncbi:MAG: haloacid dehalogenase-like hydrolase [Candidatus Diapherotrites archaeon]|nr:haloacid dehalogenase-like hydrolase [Candidatus Diapherotrites archaeon]
MKRYAFVDVDGTIVDGNMGVSLAKHMLFEKDRPFKIRNWFRLDLYFIKSAHIALLYPFSFLMPVYNYLQSGATDRYLDLLESWPEDVAERIAKTVAYSATVPPSAERFLHALISRGYRVVLISASPSITLKYLVERLDLPLQYVGLDDKHPFAFTARMKAEIIKKEFGDGIPAIVVGNPKREPFWLAQEQAVIVHSPYDLNAELLPHQPSKE